MDIPNALAGATLDALPLQLAVLDETGTIRYTNRAWRQFGAANGRATGSPGDNYLTVCDENAGDAAAVAEGLRAVIEGERDHFAHEYPRHSPDERRWFTMRAVPFTGSGERHVAVMQFDITEHRLTEEVDRERNDQLDALASVLAHDLRNPVSVAVARAQMLAADGVEDAGTIVDALLRMGDIIADALTLARQSDPEEVEPVALTAAAEEAWSHVDTVDATLSVEGSLTFEAPPGLLAQLLENLFRNSVVHGGPGVHVEVGTLGNGFYVADDGPGIPPDEHEAVLDAGYTTAADGTGFGLTIVERVAAVHGWTLDVAESASGGARFEVGELAVRADASER